MPPGPRSDEEGKAVYCEKTDGTQDQRGWELVEAQKASGKVMQVGSQRVSSLAYAKARSWPKAEIGKLNMVNAVYDRQSAIGAWEYTIPADASPGTVDWERYIEGMNRIPFDAKKFSGGATTASLAPGWPVICLYTSFPARM